MTKPAARTQQADIYQYQKRQLWAVLAWLLLAIALDKLVFHSPNLEIAKGVCAGLVLAYLGQSVFTWLAYRKTGARQRQQIMLNVYLGQMVKWAITLLGFAAIFLKLQPVHAPSVFLGYIAMQLTHTIVWLKKK